MAGAADEVMGQNILAMATLFLDSAAGEDLDRLLFDRYGLLRKQASPSVGFVELTTIAANPTAFTVPVGTLFSTGDGIQFSSLQAVTFPALSTGPISVLVQSVLAGVSQQARIGTITSIVSAVTGAPSDMACANAAATAGAADAEDDTSFRDRGRRFFTSVAKATKKALEAGALNVPGVVTAVAFEGLEFDGAPARYVEIVVTDNFTELLMSLSPTPASYQTQSQAFATLVLNSLDDVRAYGISVKVTVAVVVMQPIILQLSFLAGVDTFTISTRARGAVVAYVNSLAAGVTLTRDNLQNILRQVPGLFITGQEVTSPVGDIVPATLQVIRTALALVSLGV